MAFSLPDTYDEAYVQRLYSDVVHLHGTIMFDNLKPMQAETIYYLLTGTHTAAILPTNYGKSAILVLPGLIKSMVTQKSTISILLYPLNNLKGEQLKVLKGWNLNAIIVSDNSIETGEVQHLLENRNDQPMYLLGDPEAFLSETFRKIILPQRDLVKFLMVDEAHTVKDWGGSFRPSFKKISQLRQVFHSAVVGLFTGTFSEAMKQEIFAGTGLREQEVKIISYSPNRENIYLELRTRTSNPEEDFQFLTDEAEEQKLQMKRTLVFLSSQSDTAIYNINFRESLTYAGAVRVGELQESYLSQFEETGDLTPDTVWDYIGNHIYSETGKITQDAILDQFQDPDSHLRVLFSTVFYGMGLDNKTIDRVVLYDGDMSIASIWQKVGRAGRGGQNAHAIIFSTKSQRREIFLPNECIRVSLLSKLTGYKKESRLDSQCNCNNKDCHCSLCSCCSVCQSKCKCRYFVDADGEDCVI